VPIKRLERARQTLPEAYQFGVELNEARVREWFRLAEELRLATPYLDLSADLSAALAAGPEEPTDDRPWGV
jgi:hypothetical protein